MIKLNKPGLLDELALPLRVVVETAGKLLPFTVAILEGMRSAERGEYLQSIGRSDTGSRSLHCRWPAEAFDFAPHPVDWNDKLRFAFVAGFFLGAGAQLGVKLRWGGDWDSDGNQREHQLWDGGHIELDANWTAAERKLWEERYAATK